MQNYHKDVFTKKIYWYLIATIFMVEFTVKVSPGYLGVYLQNDYNLSHVQTGLYSALFYITYALCQFPAGYLIQYYGIKKNFIALLIIFISGLLLSSCAQSFTFLALARVLMGMGSAITFTTLLTLALQWFDEKHYPFYVGLTNLFGMLGAIGLSIVLSLLKNTYQWQAIFLILALVMTVWTLLLFFLPDTRLQTSLNPSTSEFMILFVESKFWTYLLIASVMVIPIALIPEMWGHIYLAVQYQMSSEQIPMVITLVFCGIAVGGPVIGALSQRLEIHTLLKLALYLQAFSLLMLTKSSKEFVFVPLFLLGFSASAMLLFFTLIKDIFKSIVPLAIATFNMLLTILTSVTQPMIGWLLDLWALSAPETVLSYVFIILALLNITLSKFCLTK